MKPGKCWEMVEKFSFIIHPLIQNLMLVENIPSWEKYSVNLK
jgi:hypothetical protein